MLQSLPRKMTVSYICFSHIALPIAPNALNAKWAASSYRPQRSNKTHVSCEKLSNSPSSLWLVLRQGPESESGIDAPRSVSASFSHGFLGLLEDVTDHPEFYANCLLSFLGILVFVVVISSTMDTIDCVPLLPDFFRFVGLGYCIWLAAKCAFSPSARTSLTTSTSSFVNVLTSSGVRRDVRDV